MTDVHPPTTPIAEVPLGYEPVAEFQDREDAEAHWREWWATDQSVLLVREGRWWSLWAARNPMWIQDNETQ
jgi:hypothetical protein